MGTAIDSLVAARRLEAPGQADAFARALEELPEEPSPAELEAMLGALDDAALHDPLAFRLVRRLAAYPTPDLVAALLGGLPALLGRAPGLTRALHALLFEDAEVRAYWLDEVAGAGEGARSAARSLLLALAGAESNAARWAALALLGL